MPDPKKPAVLIGQRRRAAVCFATRRIAELLDDKVVDRLVVKKFKCSMAAAIKVRQEAWAGILDVEESNREERFRSMVATLRRLYATAFRKGKLTVCAQAASQLRTMFGLDEPYIENGSKKQAEKSERTTEDLKHFAEKGEWPEEAEARQQKERKASGNPLDQLV